MSETIKVFHFHNGGGGGVLSVIRNLLRYSHNTAIENNMIFTINKDLKPVYEMPLLEGAVTQQIFYYSPDWNFYYTCQQLAKLLPDEKSVVVAHDWLELGMMSNLGLQNPVVQIVHGNYEYYYQLVKKHATVIDQFICVSSVIYKKLCLLLPQRENDIHYCRFPVPVIQYKENENENELLRLFYCVKSMDNENKQFSLLPRINAELKSRGLPVHWTIVGEGISSDEIKRMMGQQGNITIYQNLDNDKVLQVLQGDHIFLLPSLREGFPVAVVEAMKAGLVPLVTNWEGSTEDLVMQGETGFYFVPGDVKGYAHTIETLNGNPKLWKKLSEAAMQKANEMFDPLINTTRIEEIVLKAAAGIKNKVSKKIYGSRLDNQLIPNSVTKFIRSITK